MAGQFWRKVASSPNNEGGGWNWVIGVFPMSEGGSNTGLPEVIVWFLSCASPVSPWRRSACGREIRGEVPLSPRDGSVFGWSLAPLALSLSRCMFCCLVETIAGVSLDASLVLLWFRACCKSLIAAEHAPGQKTPRNDRFSSILTQRVASLCKMSMEENSTDRQGQGMAYLWAASTE